MNNKEIMEARRKCRKKSKKPYSSMTITTGDIGYNIDRFNQAFGSDVEVNTGDSCEGGMCEEYITEAKRYVRRYYIRPQNIFCSNKAEIIKALIDLDNENCSVYTLNNLGDEKDVTKLMNKDIIYYYDDGILYDKNRVKVMDYDLSIKKEENRKKFSGNADSVSDATFKDTYEDRMTDMTELEEEVFFDRDTAEVITDANSGTIYVGSNTDDVDVRVVYDGKSVSPYSHTNWVVYGEEDGTFTLCGWLIGADGEEQEGTSYTYYSIEELEAALVARGLRSLEQGAQLEEAFNQDFEPVDAWGYSLRESVITCCICGEEVDGYGNNPEPYRQKGKCCDACNLKFVIPARLEAMRAGEDSDAD